MKTATTPINLFAEIESGIQFSDLFEIEEIQRIQDLFSDATAVASIITYPDGTPITKPSNFRRLCVDVIRKTDKGCANCYKSDALIGRQNPSGPTVQNCLSAGLWDAGASITVGDKHIANWLIGQVRTEELDEQRLLNYATEIGADKVEFMDAFSEVPFMSAERFKQVSEMLFVFAKQISEKANNNLQLKNQLATQEKANELLQKSEESLSILLHSIGDGVLSTDNNGFIVSLNPIAEKLCGWTLAEAQGKPFVEVFKIVDYYTGKMVPNPIIKVLETGQTIGLANHTVLISKQGVEHQISDSAAPIKNKEGVVSGVVLVFSDVTEKYLAEAALRESERSKSVLLSNLPGMTYRCHFDREWTMEFVSDGCLELTGYNVDDLLKNNISFNELIMPEYRENLWKIWEKSVRDNEIVCEEYRIITAENEVKWVWEQGIPVFNQSGDVIALEGLILDITKRKNAEEMLQKERSMLRALIDNIPETIYSKDLASCKTLANEAEVKLLGRKSEAEVLGRDDFDFFPKEIAEKCFADDQMVMKTGKPMLNKEEFILDQTGQKRWLLTSKIPLLGNNDQIIGLIGISRNITERKKAEETLQNERLLLRTIIDNIPDLIYTKDLASRKTLANLAEVEMLGATTEAEVLGKDDFDLYPAEIARKFYDDDQQVYKSGIPIQNNEEFIIDKKGQKKWMLFSKLLLRDKENKVIGMLGIGRDISERRKTEEILQNERLLLRTVIDNIPYNIYAKDLAGRKTLANKAETEFLGVKSDAEVLGKDDFDFYPKAIAEKYRADDQLMIQKGLPEINKEGLEFDAYGNKHWLLSSKLPLRDKNNQIVGLIGISHDITDWKLAEETFMYERILLRTVIDNIPDTIYVKDLTGRKTLANKAEVRLLDAISETEVVGKTDFEFYSKEFAEKFTRDDKRLIEGGQPDLNKEGYVIDKKGKKRYLLSSKIPLRDSNNQIIGILGIAHDISNRKVMEEALQENEKFLKEIQIIAKLGTYTMKVDADSWESSVVLNSIFGIEDDFVKTIDSWISIIHPESQKEMSDYIIKDVIGTRKRFDKEYKIIRQYDKTERWVHGLGELVYNDTKEPVRMIGTIQDITERKQAEAALSESETLYRNLVSKMPDGVYKSTHDGKFVDVNPALVKMLGYSGKEELLAIDIKQELYFDTSDRESDELQVSQEEIGVFRMKKKDGSEVWLEDHGWYITDDEGEILFHEGIMRDITQRKYAEEALRESEIKYRELVDNSPDAIAIYVEGKIVFVNKECLSLMAAASAEELLGKSVFEFVHPDYRDLVVERMKNAIMDGASLQVMEEKFIKLDGSVVDVEVKTMLIRLDNKPAVQLIVRDITERKQVDNMLEKSRMEFKELFNDAPIGYHEINKDGVIIRINETEATMLGYSKEELLGQHTSILSADVNKSRRSVKAKLDGTFVPPETFEREFRKKDGTIISVLINDRLLKAHDGTITGIRSAVQDVTTLRQIDIARRESELKFRNYIDFAPHGVFVADETGFYIEVNSAATKITGYNEIELLCMNPSSLIAEDSLDNFDNHFSIALKEGFASDEFTMIRKDKSRRFITVDTVKLTDKRFLGFVVDITDRKQAEEVLRESEIFLKETQIIAKLGNCTIDILSGNWSSSEILDEILGIDAGFDRTYEGFTLLVNDEWLQILSYYFTHEVVQNQAKFDKKFKIVRQNDKEERWLHAIGELKYNNNNQPVRMIVTIQDITNPKHAEELLQNERLLLRTLIDNIPDSIYTKDLSGRKTLANHTEVKLLGGDSEVDVLGKDDFEFYSTELAEKFFADDQFVMNSGESIINKEEYLVNENGKKQWVISSKLPLRDKDNEIIGLVGTSHDITIRRTIEETLRENEKLLKETQIIAKLGICSIDINSGNWSSSEILDEILGIDTFFDKTFVGLEGVLQPEWIKQLTDHFVDDVVPNRTKFNQKFKIIRQKDKEERWVHGIGELKFDDNNQPVKLIVTVQDITERKRTAEALLESQEQLKKFAAHLQNIREEERVLLAREIHDELGQILIAIKIDTGLLRHKVLKNIDNTNEQDIRTKFDNLFSLVDNTINTTRKIMTDLRPDALELIGFIETAKQHVNNFQERHHIECRFESNILKLEIDLQQSVTLFRIIQEGLTNVARHAMATHVKIQLEVALDKLTMEITDNGKGFDENLKVKHDSYGLIGMKERVFLLGGELFISGKPGKGTCVRVEIPYVG